jgi:hypothetical protein
MFYTQFLQQYSQQVGNINEFHPMLIIFIITDEISKTL